MFYEEIIKEILENNLSIRDTAKKYGISKSQLHRQLTKAKVNIEHDLLVEFNKYLQNNKNKGRKRKEEK